MPPEASQARPIAALVLSGGGARGAYEVGVLDYLVREVAADAGPLRFDILCGTSAGALIAAALAAHADEPVKAAELLVQRWTALSLEEVLRPSARGLCALAASLAVPGRKLGGANGPALLDARPLARMLAETVPFERIDAFVADGTLRAVALCATHVATGRAHLFVQRGPRVPEVRLESGELVVRDAALRAEHAMASAAIPLLFTPVRIGGDLYCDGALRQNVPISSAIYLGAQALVVMTPHTAPTAEPAAAVGKARQELFGDPVYLLGKVLNALILDRVDEDLERIQEANALWSAVDAAGGPELVERLERELLRRGSVPAPPVSVLTIRASRSIAQRSAAFVRSGAFALRIRGAMGAAMRYLVDGQQEADLISYLLFDGAFARELIEMGREDARDRHDELCAWVAGGPVPPAPADAAAGSAAVR